MVGITTLGNVDLGIVTGVFPVSISKFADISIPLGRGDSKQFLGMGTTKIILNGTYNSANRYEQLNQLWRQQKIGASLKLDSDPIKTVVQIIDVNPSELEFWIDYALTLEETRFQQENDCDSTSLWSEDSGGGALTAPTSTPTPREGSACIKLAGTIAAATESRLLFTPSDALDFSFSSWVAFDFLTDMLTDMTAATLTLKHDAGNYVTYDFSALVTVAGEWIRIRVSKADFAETGTMEWDQVTSVEIGLTRSSEQTYYIAVDDFGGYE